MKIATRYIPVTEPQIRSKGRCWQHYIVMCGLPFKNGLFAMGCKNSVRSNNPILWIRSSGTKFGFGEPTQFRSLVFPDLGLALGHLA